MTIVNACWSDEHEVWIFAATKAPDSSDHDPAWGRFSLIVGTDVWQTFADAQAAVEAAYKRLLASSGLASDQPACARPCSQFRCEQPDPTQFLGTTLYHRCKNCGHYQADHAQVARGRVA